MEEDFSNTREDELADDENENHLFFNFVNNSII
jgi:hypothetical protein